MSNRFIIVGLGEALMNILPDAQYVGGAPLNVTAYAHQLARKQQGSGVLVSRLGQDEAGRQITEHLTSRQMETTYLQTDPDLATGRVYTRFDTQGQAEHEIIQNVAWNVMQYDPDLEELARRCDAVYFGTLALRHTQSRQTIYRFLAEARRAVKLFDLNLHGQAFDASIFRRSCEQATAVKLNQRELPEVCGALGLDDSATENEIAKKLLSVFELNLVVLTRGSQGTLLVTADQVYEQAPADYPPGQNADSIGAGDACCAAVLAGLAMRINPEKIVTLANHAGSFAASQPGGTAELPPEIVNMVG